MSNNSQGLFPEREEGFFVGEKRTPKERKFADKRASTASLSFCAGMWCEGWAVSSLLGGSIFFYFFMNKIELAWYFLFIGVGIICGAVAYFNREK